MFLLKLAVRNLFRNFPRSLLTMITVFVGVFGFVVSSGLVNGVEQSYVRIEVETEAAHMRVMGKGYLKEEESLPLDVQVAKPAAVKAALQKRWPKAVVVERIIFSGQLGDGVNALPVRGVVVDVDAFTRAFQFKSTQKGGKKKEFLPKKGNYLVIGAGLAKAFGKKAGDTMTLLTRTRAGSFNAIDFKLWDVVSTGNFMIDSFSVYLSQATGRALLQMPKGITDMVVRFPSASQSKEAAKVVAKVSSDRAQTWQEKTKTIFELNSMRRKIMNFLITIILLVGAAGTANTILMSGFERKGEIGMMTAMGMPSGQIIRMFAIEASALGLFGSLVGGLAGAALVLYFQANGLDVSATMDSMTQGNTGTGMSIASVLYFEFRLSAVLIGMFIGVLVSVLAALWPSWQTTRFEPREILSGS